MPGGRAARLVTAAPRCPGCSGRGRIRGLSHTAGRIIDDADQCPLCYGIGLAREYLAAVESTIRLGGIYGCGLCRGTGHIHRTYAVDEYKSQGRISVCDECDAIEQLSMSGGPLVRRAELSHVHFCLNLRLEP